MNSPTDTTEDVIGLVIEALTDEVEIDGEVYPIYNGEHDDQSPDNR